MTDRPQKKRPGRRDRSDGIVREKLHALMDETEREEIPVPLVDLAERVQVALDKVREDRVRR